MVKVHLHSLVSTAIDFLSLRAHAYDARRGQFLVAFYETRPMLTFFIPSAHHLTCHLSLPNTSPAPPSAYFDMFPYTPILFALPSPVLQYSGPAPLAQPSAQIQGPQYLSSQAFCKEHPLPSQQQRLPVLFQLRIAVPQDHIHLKVSWDIGEAGLSTTEVPVIIGSGMGCTVFDLWTSTSLHSRDILGTNNNRETWSRRGLGGAMSWEVSVPIHTNSVDVKYVLNHTFKDFGTAPVLGHLPKKKGDTSRIFIFV
ncbi:hypothetical protein DFJ58DRAFT_910535 [Suillus subalutaceus]|uniref:uncharacterized protein n=1 Tax=Suillus subalutaceus TaxID=48586 RepID=UPI001B860B45|nr:uncharacterized protein DFJ58DRAFT_910535 [Suillus subalutaceus]KAG1872929.1 hypothetical protein DFJ58DRAFT_910535 [Suillus subalutaceus]